MIAQHIKNGATVLERWLLNQGKYKTALYVRSFRGIAPVQDGSEAARLHAEHDANRLCDKLGLDRGTQMVINHVMDESCFDQYWESLEKWINNFVDLNELERKRQQIIDQSTSSWTIEQIHSWGYTSDAILTTKIVSYGRFGIRPKEVEFWKFPDGEMYTNSQGAAYAMKAGFYDDLLNDLIKEL